MGFKDLFKRKKRIIPNKEYYDNICELCQNYIFKGEKWVKRRDKYFHKNCMVKEGLC